MNILILEDDQDLKEMNVSLLSRAGRSILAASTVQECLDLIKEHPFDLIVSDFDLKGETCKDLVSRLQFQKVLIPIVLYSATPQAENFVSADYLVTSIEKPNYEALEIVVCEFEKLMNKSNRRIGG